MPLDEKDILERMRDKRRGTVGTLLEIAKSQGSTEARLRFMEELVIRLIRLLEASRIHKENVLRRGSVAKLIFEAWSEAAGSPIIHDPVVSCPQCKSPCKVVAVDGGVVTLECLAVECGHRFTETVNGG